MAMAECCASCLYEKQQHVSGDAAYLAEIRQIIENRRDCDTPPYLLYLFQQAYERRFGKASPFAEIKRRYNDLVLSMEDAVRAQIESAADPLTCALIFARVGNYIDFGALDRVDEEDFLKLFRNAKPNERDAPVLDAFLSQCEAAERFLLICDNCGEIVLDKLFLEQLKKKFPALSITVMVRGEETLNDATREDALYVGMDRVAKIVTNGTSIAGTVYATLPSEAREALDRADVTLAKGQGNYESLSRQGRHIFYSFLCKCELFTGRFQVPLFSGVFAEERE